MCLMSPYYLSDQNSYTHHPLTDRDVLNSERTVFIYDAVGQSFRISLRKWLVTFLNTSLTLPSDIPIYDKIQNTKCSGELQCAQKIPVFPLMCELHVTVKYTVQHAVPSIAGEDKRLHTCGTNSWPEIYSYVKRRKGKKEIIAAINDHNRTTITDAT